MISSFILQRVIGNPERKKILDRIQLGDHIYVDIVLRLFDRHLSGVIHLVPFMMKLKTMLLQVVLQSSLATFFFLFVCLMVVGFPDVVKSPVRVCHSHVKTLLQVKSDAQKH